MLLFAGIFKVIPGPFTDIKLYPKIFSNGESFAYAMYYFPREIPENAEDVEMRYWRGLLQGRGYFWLKYKTDIHEIEELKKKYPFENRITSKLHSVLRGFNYFEKNRLETDVFDEENNPFYSYDISYKSGIGYNNSTQEVFYWYYVE